MKDTDDINRVARRTLKYATLRIYLWPTNGNTMRYTYEPGHLFDLCRTQLRIRDDGLPNDERLRLLRGMQDAVIEHLLAPQEEVTALNSHYQIPF